MVLSFIRYPLSGKKKKKKMNSYGVILRENVV